MRYRQQRREEGPVWLPAEKTVAITTPVEADPTWRVRRDRLIVNACKAKPQKVVAVEFGVCQQYVSRIVRQAGKGPGRAGAKGWGRRR